MSRPFAACLVTAVAVALTGCGSSSTPGATDSPAATGPGAPTSPAAGIPTSIDPSGVVRPSPKPSVALNGNVDTGPTSLTVVVRNDSSAEPSTWTLTCHPAGGTHPRPQEACDALASAGGAAGLSIPSDRMCAQVYGGPATASIHGTLDGNRVQAQLAQTDGCRIAQWNALSEVLGSRTSAD